MWQNGGVTDSIIAVPCRLSWWGAYCYCTSCPLFGGFSQFGNMEEEPECWYYDMEEMQEEKRLPEEQEMRTGGLDLSGDHGEFPDYLPHDETARPFSV